MADEEATPSWLASKANEDKVMETASEETSSASSVSTTNQVSGGTKKCSKRKDLSYQFKKYLYSIGETDALAFLR